LICAHHGDRFAPLPELLADIFFHFSIQLSDFDGLRRPIGTAYLASEYFSEGRHRQLFNEIDSFLREERYVVIHAANGEEALAWCGRWRGEGGTLGVVGPP
jgi:hypothetical protein